MARNVPASPRRALPKPPKDWNLQYDETLEDASFTWHEEHVAGGGVFLHGVIQTSAEIWRRIHAEDGLARKMLDAMWEAKKYPGVTISRPVPPSRVRGAKPAPARTDLQNLMSQITELATKLSVASPQEALELSARYAELRERLDMMHREFGEAESMLEMARTWLSDETRRPDEAEGDLLVGPASCA